MSTLDQLKMRRDELNRELMSIHLKIAEAQQAASPEHKCRLNGKEIVSKGRCCGAFVRMHLAPEQAGYAIFCENSDQQAPDILVGDGDPIPNGARLYSVPPAWGA